MLQLYHQKTANAILKKNKKTSQRLVVALDAGFEPAMAFTIPVFETGSLDHSDNQATAKLYHKKIRFANYIFDILTKCRFMI